MKSHCKNISGGYINNPYKQLESFLSMIILGYFGVKVVYGIFFKFYPQKYYYRNIEINTSETDSNAENTKNVVLNAYIPGAWNTEITDFVVAVILGLIVYVYTNMSTRAMIHDDGTLNSGLLIGYLIGLGFPPIMEAVKPLLEVNEDNNMGRSVLNCLSVFLVIVIIIVIIISNYSSLNNEDITNKVSYITYIAIILLLIFGLFIARKTQETIGPVTYNFSTKESCNRKSQKYIMTSGDLVKISPVFVVFICLLLFSYNPEDLGWKYLYILIYGLFLGIFVSGISYYGIEYFLIKQPIKQCDTLGQCGLLDNVSEEDVIQGLETAEYNKGSLNVIKIMLIVALLVVFGYLIYNNIKR